MKVITEKLKEFRNAKGLSQTDMAKLLSKEQTAYGKIELGKNDINYETAL